jgi:phenylacetic acid degradation operon negative regulatory protein
MSRPRLPDLGLKPLTARSLALTALLGSHPPQLPARALVALGSHFGIAEGAMRTALSRMVVAGELEASDGQYLLGTRLRQRQAAQDAGLRPPDEPWDGSWWFAIVTTPRRAIADRRTFRALMAEHRMGELRPDTWLRPANIPRPPGLGGVLVVQGAIGEEPAADLVGRLWDLGEIAASARFLARLADEARGWLDSGDPGVLPDTFLVSVAAVRFLRHEPQLPSSVAGTPWPPNDLRATYERLRRGHLDLMASFLATASS